MRRTRLPRAPKPQAKVAPKAAAICIQVQLSRLKHLEEQELEATCRVLAAGTNGVKELQVVRGHGLKSYLNVNFLSDKPLTVWPEIWSALYVRSSFATELRGASIAVATGESGWNDYLLLHHFDPKVELDRASEA
jgi:hypothetical protein